MYRIEVRPGEETVFRNMEELATGIRNGFITPRARIWHAATQKWLPIEFHPHYKKALAGDFTPTPTTPQPSLAAMPAPVLTPAPAPVLTPAPAPLLTPAPAPVLTPVPTPALSAIVAMRAALAAPPAEVPPVHHAEMEAPDDSAEPEEVIQPEPEPEPEPAPPRRHSPAEVFQAVRPEPEPELVLPHITYPEVPPPEDSAELPIARRSRRMGGRPLLLIGSAAALVFVAQMVLRSRSATRGEAEAVAEPAPVPEQPAAVDSKPPARPAQPAAPRTASAQPAASRAPAVVMTPGPAFAPSVPARPGAAPADRPPAAAPAPAPKPSAAPVAESAPSIAPAPEAIDLHVPDLPVSDSLAADPARADSLAIKRILKAVSGKKPVVLPGQ
jgi:hypothetical protein